VAEAVDWATFLDRFDWRQGEHVSIVGPTGSGKSVLGLALLDRRRYVVALANKPRDRELDRLVKRGGGWSRIKAWPPPAPARLMPRVVLWPKPRSLATVVEEQGEAFADALNGIYGAGGWCIYVDETYYVANDLGLSKALKVLWQQGRSLGISIVACSQRPAWVPLEMFSEASHLFLFRMRDRQALRRLGEVGNVDPAELADTVRDLPRHGFAYVDARSGSILTSRVER
jgi:hypothetical protein